MINFKEPHMMDQYEKLPARLKAIVDDFDKISAAFGINPIMVTRVSDPVKGESGVHLYNRAVDFRDEFGGKRTYTVSQVAAILEYLNKKYPRSDKFQVAVHHSFSGDPSHFHFQIPAAWV